MQRAAQTGDGENGEEFNLSLLISVPSPLGAAVMEMPGGAKIESGLRGSLAEGGQRRELCEAPVAASASNKKGRREQGGCFYGRVVISQRAVELKDGLLGGSGAGEQRRQQQQHAAISNLHAPTAGATKRISRDKGGTAGRARHGTAHPADSRAGKSP